MIKCKVCGKSVHVFWSGMIGKGYEYITESITDCYVVNGEKFSKTRVQTNYFHNDCLKKSKVDCAEWHKLD